MVISFLFVFRLLLLNGVSCFGCGVCRDRFFVMFLELGDCCELVIVGLDLIGKILCGLVCCWSF